MSDIENTRDHFDDIGLPFNGRFTEPGQLPAMPGRKLMAEFKKTIALPANLSQAIDLGVALDELSKTAKKYLDPIKDVIRSRSDDKGELEFSGSEGMAKISPTTETDIDPRALFIQMMKEGLVTIKQNKKGEYNVDGEYFKLVKVKITDTKALMGEASLAPITTKTAGTSKVSFKAI